MKNRNQCIAITKKGKQCKHLAFEGASYCSTHLELSNKDGLPKRRVLGRKDILQLLKDNGGSQGLDLTYTNISKAKLGSSITAMPDLSEVIFGKYGDVRSGTIADQTMFPRVKLKRAKFTYARLKKANFYKSDLTETDLRFSDLTEATMVDAILVRANLFDARLQDVNFQNADLRQADLYLAKLSGRTNLRKDNIGKKVLQEDLQTYKNFLEHAILSDSRHGIEEHLKDRFLKAKIVYESLRLHFEENGYLSDANWAYRRERRMGKKWTGQQIEIVWHQKQKWQAIKHLFKWINDWIVELLCDYGESIWRVIGWMFALLFVIGPLLINLFGGLEWIGDNRDTYFNLNSNLERWIYIYFQQLLYMIDTLTTANFAELKPRTDAVRLLSGFMSLLGIFLAGLLGFVAGNRIRNS